MRPGSFDSEYHDAEFLFPRFQGHKVPYYSGAVEGVDGAVEHVELEANCLECFVVPVFGFPGRVPGVVVIEKYA